MCVGGDLAREGMGEERVEVSMQPRPPLPTSQQHAVDEFWRGRQEEIEATVDFTERMLPMARLKKVIHSATEEDDDGMMISKDTPAFLSKVCELFVQELAVRAWACAESHNRRIILDSDIAEAVATTEYYDFLIPVLLEHLHGVSVERSGRTPPAMARILTRKRHRPDLDPRRAVRRVPLPPRVHPVTPAPPAPLSSARYVSYPFPMEDELILPAPPMNYTTRGCVFFRNGNSSGNTFSSSNFAAEMVRSPALAASAGELQPSAPPAPYCLHSYPVIIDGNLGAFAAGNTAATEIPAGNAHGDGGAHRESVVAQKMSSDVQDADAAAAGGLLGGTPNESPMYMLLEDILLDEDLLITDAADMFPPVLSAPPDPEDFVIDHDVLDDVFADPSSTSSSN